MQIGVVFPQSELGGDAGASRAYAEAVEAMGYRHLLVYDHVVGADPEHHAPWRGPYDLDTTFHEPFVFFGFLAAATRHLELVTGIVILPQRQTVLVAKQAAAVDVLSGGRLRLGVGIGWNAVEYEALGKEFGNRGARSEEQVELLRRLWTERSVTFTGDHERVTAAGLAPLPVQQPIPLWFGVANPRGYRRAGRLGDGWFPMVPPGPHLEEAKAMVDAGAAEAGRDPSSVGMEGRVSWSAGGLDTVLDHTDRWRRAGATHVGVNTMGAGFTSVEEHIDALGEVAEALGLSSP